MKYLILIASLFSVSAQAYSETDYIEDVTCAIVAEMAGLPEDYVRLTHRYENSEFQDESKVLVLQSTMSMMLHMKSMNFGLSVSLTATTEFMRTCLKED